MKTIIWIGLGFWLTGALVWTLAICAAARAPRNRRTHRLARWLVKGGTLS